MSKITIPFEDPNKIRGLRALANFLGISLCTAHRFKSAGKIPYYQIGRILFFDKKEVLKSMKGGQNE